MIYEISLISPKPIYKEGCGPRFVKIGRSARYRQGDLLTRFTTTSMMFWLSDENWTRIQLLLPTYKHGFRRVDGRSVISDILHVLKTIMP